MNTWKWNLIFAGAPPFLGRALALACIGTALSSPAATLIWTGGHASSANWNLRDNWGGAAIPAHGDTLVFPSGVPRPINTNNIAGLRVDSIQFLGLGGGYNLRGHGLTVSNGISAQADAVNTISLAALTFEGAQSISVVTGGWLTVSSDISLRGDLSLLVVGDLTLSGAISGTGNVIKSGAGLLTFSGPGANTYSGTTTINEGTFAMNKRETISVVPLVFESRIAVPGDLFVSQGSGATEARWNFDDQITNAATVTLAQNTTLNLNGNNDTFDRVVMTGASLLTGAGTLNLNEGVTAHPSTVSSIVNGHVILNQSSTFSVADGAASIDLDIPAAISSVGLSGFTKTGAGTLRLAGANTYQGATIVNAGLVRAAADDAFGTSSSGTTINEGAELLIETAVNTMRERFTIAGAGIGGASGAIRIGSGATLATNIVLSAPATILTMGGGNLTLGGVISGTGPLTKVGPGTLVLSGSPNTFSGDLWAREGLLLLDKTPGNAVPGNLIVGANGAPLGGTTATARYLAPSQVFGTVTVNGGSVLDLNGELETITQLTLSGGGTVETGAGELYVTQTIMANPGPVTNGSTSTINGRLNFGVATEERHIVVAESGGTFGDGADLVINARIRGGVPIIKAGAGDLSLTASNTFTGPFTVAEGELRISDDDALGTTGENTLLVGTSTLFVSGGVVVDEPLFLNTTGAMRNQGSNVWQGSIFLGQTAVLNVPASSTLNLRGIISGLGGVTKTGSGTLLYSGTVLNTYSGTTSVDAGILRLARTGGSDMSIHGPLIIGDGLGGPDADVVELASASTQIENISPITVESSGLLLSKATAESELIGKISGTGHVRTENFALGSYATGGPVTFDGVISGPGQFQKFGFATMTLNGANTLTGDTKVWEGTLVVNGSQTSSDVEVATNATLRGEGRVGNLLVKGTLAPGNPVGMLRAETIQFAPGSILAVELHDQYIYDSIDSAGTIDVTGATLQVSLGNHAPYEGKTFLIGDGWPTTGTFAGLPENSQLVVSDIPFRVHYDVGSIGDYIALTVDELPLRLSSTRVEGGNGNGRIDVDECNDLFITLENPTGALVSIYDAHLDSDDHRLMVTKADALYGLMLPSTTRSNRNAFQIRTAPNYPCGRPAGLSLVVQTYGRGRFSIPVPIPTGSTGAFQIFPSTAGAQAIPEAGVLESNIEITNDFRVGKVRVTLHAAHPAAGDLRFMLYTPWGHGIPLALNRGGSGANYGTSCFNRTAFDDDAPTGIESGTAPFVGMFAPETSMAGFRGYPANGTWTLHAWDTEAGNVGTLQCWSLQIAPAECPDGGGSCRSCLGIVNGSLSTNTPAMPQQLRRVGDPSGCGNVGPCPGGITNGFGPFRYRVHAFTNTGPTACVTVVLNVPCAEGIGAGLMAAAYLKQFSPTDLCANWIGGLGSDYFTTTGDVANGSGGFSFQVPVGERFLVVVNERNPFAPFTGCENYTLEVYGLPCAEPEPRLQISQDAGPDRVRLHWSTAYPGFTLQRAGAFGQPGTFTATVNPIIVGGGEYNVTNSVTGTNEFYRLFKP